jgi:uncharacterized glyoxalase superfamily protein PhnB/predicted alpha/beta hydrolase family esterase
MKKKQVLFIHSGGSQGHHEGSSDLVAYLRHMLGADYQVLCPPMPDPDNPEYLQWKVQLRTELAGVEDGVIVVGHSLGGSVLLKYLSEEKCTKPITGLCVVAAPYWGKRNWQVDEYILQKNFAERLHYIPNILLYHSRNDEVVPFKHLSLYAGQLPNALVRTFSNRGHLFNKGIPELVEDIRTLAVNINNIKFNRMATVNTYLNFNGNTEEAFTFYKSVFGGEFTTFQRFSDTPHGEHLPANEKDKIMHVSLPIGKGTILMATDFLESMGQKLIAGNNFSIAVSPDSKEEAKKLFDGLSAGGTVTMPLEDTFWGAYFGMFTDKFGVQWMVNFDYNQHK